MENTTIPADFYNEVTTLVIDTLSLETTVEEVDLDAPLFGDGLGLDSIDILEIALVVSKNYGLQLRADSKDNHTIFNSMRSFSVYIHQNRTK